MRSSQVVHILIGISKPAKYLYFDFMKPALLSERKTFPQNRESLRWISFAVQLRKIFDKIRHGQYSNPQRFRIRCSYSADRPISGANSFARAMAYASSS